MLTARYEALAKQGLLGTVDPVECAITDRSAEVNPISAYLFAVTTQRQGLAARLEGPAKSEFNLRRSLYEPTIGHLLPTAFKR